MCRACIATAFEAGLGLRELLVDHRSASILHLNTPSDANVLSLLTEAINGTARLRVPGGGVLSLVADVDSLARHLIRALFTASTRLSEQLCRCEVWTND